MSRRTGTCALPRRTPCSTFRARAHRALLENLAARQPGWGAHFSVTDVRRAFSGRDTTPEWRDRFDAPWNFYAPEAIARRQERWAEEDTEDLTGGGVRGRAGALCTCGAQDRPERPLPVRQREEVQEVLSAEAKPVRAAEPGAAATRRIDLKAAAIPVRVAHYRALESLTWTSLSLAGADLLMTSPERASAPQSGHRLRDGGSISRLHTWPARSPVNASPLPSPTTMHDSEPVWVALSLHCMKLSFTTPCRL